MRTMDLRTYCCSWRSFMYNACMSVVVISSASTSAAPSTTAAAAAGFRAAFVPMLLCRALALLAVASALTSGVFCNAADLWQTQLVDVDGLASRTVGRLEVRPNSTAPWGTVSSAGFDSTDAARACAAMGYPLAAVTATIVSNMDFLISPVLYSSTPIYLSGVSCTNAHETLAQCPATHMPQETTHARDVSIQCAVYPSTPSYGYRLADSTVNSSSVAGLLEVREGPLAPWGLVCGDRLNTDVATAAAACRSLRLSPSHAEMYWDDGLRSPTVFYSGFVCPPTASHLSDCGAAKSSRTPRDRCAYGTVPLGIRCGLPIDAFRIVSSIGADSTEGVVMYRPTANVTWGGVCSSDFDVVDATAVCRTLVPTSILGIPLPNYGIRNTSIPRWLSAIDCATNSDAAGCAIAMKTEGDACPSDQAVGVRCLPGTITADWSLTPQVTRTPNGFAELRVAVAAPLNAWDTVSFGEFCGDGVDQAAANAMCRHFGFPGNAHLRPFVPRTAAFNVDLRCPSESSSLMSCNVTRRSSYTSTSIALSCGLNLTFRLIDGLNSLGRLEVQPNATSVWGTVCGNSFTIHEAWAVCRSLGFNPREVKIVQIGAKSGSGPIWLDDVMCAQGTRRIEQCSFSLDRNKCSHSSDVNIDCDATPGWLVAVLVCGTIGGLGVVSMALSAIIVCLCFDTREERAELRRQEAVERMFNQLGPDEEHGNLFENDLPPELRPHGAGVELVAADMSLEFVAPAQTETPLGPFFASRSQVLARLQGESSQFVYPISVAYIHRLARGLTKPAWRSPDGSIAWYHGWDMAGGMLYPVSVVVCPTHGALEDDIVSQYRSLERENDVAVQPIVGLCFVGPGDELTQADGHGCRVCIIVPAISTLCSLAHTPVIHLGAYALQREATVVTSYAASRALSVLLVPDAIFVCGDTFEPGAFRFMLLPAPQGHNAFRQLHQFTQQWLIANPNTASLVMGGGPLFRERIPQKSGLSGLFATTADDDSIQRCVVCNVVVHSAGHHMRGVECSHTAMHFVCADCVNTRMSALLTDATVEMAELPCPMGCAGQWSFDDFAALTHPRHLRQWQRLSVESLRRRLLEAAQGLLDQAERMSASAEANAEGAMVRKHCMELRKLLRPACPHCGLIFESFTGCLLVTCGARSREGALVSGCGQSFCGACMTTLPCPQDCGHGFATRGELLRKWRVWRLGRCSQYVKREFGVFRGGRVPQDTTAWRLLDAMHHDFEMVGIWPLQGFESET
jgi:hypothetical protein